MKYAGSEDGFELLSFPSKVSGRMHGRLPRGLLNEVYTRRNAGFKDRRMLDEDDCKHFRRIRVATELRAPRCMLTDAEMRANVIRLAFDGDEAAFDTFCTIVHDSVPEAE